MARVLRFQTALAAQYPGTKVAVWNRNTRAILAETDGY